MKELHNHIFSKTTCISKETMLKYMNQQLSEKEEHDIQKHLIDCDFCSEALEGMEYATNSSVLFTIDHKIDNIVAKKKTPILKNLMLAASVLVVLFGSYFSYLTFNNVVTKNESKISLNTATPKADNEVLEEIVPAFEESGAKESEAKNLQQENRTEGESVNTLAFSQPIVEQNRKLKEVEKIVLEDVIEESEPTSFAANAKMLDYEVEEELAEADMVTKTVEETVTLSTTGSTMTRADNMPLKLDKAYKSSENKKREKQKANAPAPAEKEPTLAKDRDENLAGGMFDNKNNDATTLENTGYISTEVITSDDDFTDEAKEEMKSSLDKAIALFEQNKYKQAIKYLDIELMTKTTRNKSKTHWYKALCLIELNKIEEAKTNLTQVINYNDEYLIEAKNKLTELK